MKGKTIYITYFIEFKSISQIIKPIWGQRPYGSNAIKKEKGKETEH